MHYFPMPERRATARACRRPAAVRSARRSQRGVVLVEGGEDHDSVAAAFAASGCVLAIVCGRDEDYPAAIGPLLRGLIEAGAKQVWIAGRPPREAWPDASGLAYLYLGCDVLEPLTHALRLIGALEGAV